MKKDNYVKIILIIIMVFMCLLSSYLVIKTFKDDNKNINDDTEEINLGGPRNQFELDNPTPRATPIPSCSTNMRNQNACIAEARGNCSNGYTGCDTAVNGCYSYTCNQNECRITDMRPRYQAASFGKDYTITVYHTGACYGKSISISTTGQVSSNSSTVTISTGDVTTFNIKIGNQCGNGSYSASFGGVTFSQNVTVYGEWTDYTNKNITAPPPSYKTKTEADKNGATEYGNCEKAENQDYYICTTYGTRGCNVRPPSYACYGDAEKFENATKVDWLTGPSGDYKYKYANLNQASCKLQTITPPPESACYGNAAKFDDATMVAWLPAPIDEYQHKYDGISEESCKKDIITPTPVITTPPPTPTSTPTPPPACYGDTEKFDDASKVDWLTGPSGDYKYKYDSIKDEASCQLPPPGCYGNQPYLGIASSVKWFTSGTHSDHPYLYSNIGDEKSCGTLPGSDKCTDKRVAPDVASAEASVCEDTVSFDINYSSATCSSGTKSFYTIACNKHVVTDFDYEADGVTTVNKSLYAGEGFKYRIGVRTTTKCESTFNGSTWKTSFNRVMDKLETVKNGGTNARSKYKENNPIKFGSFVNGLPYGNDVKSKVYELYNLAKEIEKIVISYNNYTPQFDTNDNAELKMSYLVNGTRESFNYKLNSTKSNCVDEKNVKSTDTSVTSVAPWLTAPKDYSVEHSDIVYLDLPEILLNKITGEETRSKANSLSGGNRIIINKNADAQTISNININVSGLAGNNSSVKNNKCKIKVDKKDLLYRPIEITNPFIDASWKKGDNWINPTYNFTNIIDPDVWSKDSLYVIDLSKDAIQAIKESNASMAKSGISPYIGLCNKSSDMWDKGTSIICKALK